MVWRKKELFKSLRSFLDVKRIDKIPNAQVRDLFGVKKWVDE